MNTPGRIRSAVLGVLVALAAFGCGDDTPGGEASTETRLYPMVQVPLGWSARGALDKNVLLVSGARGSVRISVEPLRSERRLDRSSGDVQDVTVGGRSLEMRGTFDRDVNEGVMIFETQDRNVQISYTGVGGAELSDVVRTLQLVGAEEYEDFTDEY
jgi:hypothetical protein